METQLEQIREQQKASWDTFSLGWKKWDELMMDFMKPVGDEIIQQIDPQGEDMVLDIAAGTGEPGLTIASIIPKGKVVITDLSDNMLEIALENATKRGLSNVTIKACDVCELPFEDATFDKISCRFGFMFFPDMQLAANEMVRVLKPGGKIAIAVWNGPEKNFWITVAGDTINRNMQLDPPAQGAPGIFRCATAGLMVSLFKKAGLKQVDEKEVLGLLKSETAETYWNMVTEVAAPFVAALNKADEAMRSKIKKEVFQLLHEQYPADKVMIPSSAQIIFGTK